jgi:hypothetical protein
VCRTRCTQSCCYEQLEAIIFTDWTSKLRAPAPLPLAEPEAVFAVVLLAPPAVAPVVPDAVPGVVVPVVPAVPDAVRLDPLAVLSADADAPDMPEWPVTWTLWPTCADRSVEPCRVYVEAAPLDAVVDEAPLVAGVALVLPVAPAVVPEALAPLPLPSAIALVRM